MRSGALSFWPQLLEWSICHAELGLREEKAGYASNAMLILPSFRFSWINISSFAVYP
jgi:hypothetical protein